MWKENLLFWLLIIISGISIYSSLYAQLSPSLALASSLTQPQVSAIIGLLEAFGVDQQTIQLVESELGQPAVNNINPNLPVSTTKAPVEDTTPTTPQPSVDLKVNGADGPVLLTPNDCITAGIKTCATATVSWTSQGTTNPGCGITGGYGWAGNFGTSGSKSMAFKGNSTLVLQCNINNNLISDSVIVRLDTTAVTQALKDLNQKYLDCESQPIPLGDIEAQCTTIQEQLNALQATLVQ